ncbi:hypothetical protein [Pacificispira sp.]|uniref:hypothetical protein n=1 Tax=Pacificispira sp. TaxID=2888761 RepID=UPI003B52B53C
MKLLTNVINWLKKSCDWSNTEFPAFHKYAFIVLSYLFTIVVTIYITPSISEDFERENRITAFYVENLKTLSTDTKDLLANLTVYPDIYSIQPNFVDVKNEIRRDITRLHWRRVEFFIIFDDDETREILELYSESLNNISGIVGSQNPDFDQLNNEIENFGVSSGLLMQKLADKAGI